MNKLFKIEFQLAAGKEYLDGPKEESHFLIVGDDLNPRDFNNNVPLEKMMARQAGCSVDDIYHWWYDEVEIPMILTQNDIIPIDTYDNHLIGAVVPCAREIGVLGLVVDVKPELQSLVVKSFGNETFILPFNEVYGTVKREIFK